MSPRVTLGIATYLHDAAASCLRQTYDDLEVLVVLEDATSCASTTRWSTRPA
jgi:hypothetical protein